MTQHTQHTTIDRTEAYHRITDMIRCKWTLAILDALDAGDRRPSEVIRRLPGLTDKVLADRLRKFEDFGLISREAFAEIPPRVEYTLTPRGGELAVLVRHVGRFVDQWTCEDPA